MHEDRSLVMRNLRPFGYILLVTYSNISNERINNKKILIVILPTLGVSFDLLFLFIILHCTLQCLSHSKLLHNTALGANAVRREILRLLAILSLALIRY